MRGKQFAPETGWLVRYLRELFLPISAIIAQLASSGIAISKASVYRLLKEGRSQRKPVNRRKPLGFRRAALQNDTAAGQRLQRHILRTLKGTGHHISAQRLCTSAGVKSVSTRTCQRYLRSLDQVRLSRPRKECELLCRHRVSRKEQARTLLTRFKKGLSFNSVLCLDEKRFSLDGPDGPQRVWHVVGHRPTRCSRIAGGAGIMLCLGVSGRGMVWKLFKQGETVTSARYSAFLDTVSGGSQQPRLIWDDQASSHRTRATQEAHLTRKTQRLLDSPKMQDCQLVEKMLALVSNKLYASNRQFHSVGELMKALQTTLTDLHQTGEGVRVAQLLWAKLPARLQAIVEGDGGFCADRW